jgi:hypothetical protein
MLKVIIASGSESDATLIERKLTPITRALGEVRFHGARPANLSAVLDANYNLLIYNCQHFSSSMRYQVQELRSIGYLGPIMILGKVPHPNTIDRFSDMRSVTIVEKPYDNKDIQGIAIKYLRDAVVEQRRHRRFDTFQKVKLESYNKDFASQTLISNISRGGAHIQGELNDISRGDLLRVSFELDQLQKSRTVSAEVVWTRGDVGAEERSAGLRFISKAKVYEALLNGF